MTDTPACKLVINPAGGPPMCLCGSDTYPVVNGYPCKTTRQALGSPFDIAGETPIRP